MISLIAAMSVNRVIGINNTLPWHLPNDLNNFRTITMDKPVVMGRKTWESLKGPLKGRTNIVVSRNKKFIPKDAVLINDLESIIDISISMQDEIFIIGGEEIYRQMLPYADFIYLTVVNIEIEGDAYFPEINENYWGKIYEERVMPDNINSYGHTFYKFRRKI